MALAQFAGSLVFRRLVRNREAILRRLTFLRQILAITDHDRQFSRGGHVTFVLLGVPSARLRPCYSACLRPACAGEAVGAVPQREWSRGLAASALPKATSACSVSSFVGLWLLRCNDLVVRI